MTSETKKPAAKKPYIVTAGNIVTDDTGKKFGGDKAMSYWSTPLEALEDPDLLAAWAGRGIDAAARAKTKPKTRRRP